MNQEAHNTTDWALVHVGSIAWKQDQSGIHVLIHRIITTETHKEYAGERITVRVDVITASDNPIISFQGNGADVRKVLVRWFADRSSHHYIIVSNEHAAYIGAEIERAMIDPNYKQD